jgi:hypothetical protein
MILPDLCSGKIPRQKGFVVSYTCLSCLVVFEDFSSLVNELVVKVVVVFEVTHVVFDFVVIILLKLLGVDVFIFGETFVGGRWHCKKGDLLEMIRQVPLIQICRHRTRFDIRCSLRFGDVTVNKCVPQRSVIAERALAQTYAFYWGRNSVNDLIDKLGVQCRMLSQQMLLYDLSIASFGEVFFTKRTTPFSPMLKPFVSRPCTSGPKRPVFTSFKGVRVSP